MEHRQLLRGKCDECQGLCCVSLAFDRSAWFASDKAADTPCPQLDAAHRCQLHEHLDAAGYPGCTSYDCFGAGQRVSRELFAGTSWRDEPSRAAAMFSAFRRLKELHELRWLLHEASRLELGPAHAEQRRRLLALLEPAAPLDAAALDALDLDALGLQTRRLLRELRAYLPAPLGLRRLAVLG